MTHTRNPSGETRVSIREYLDRLGWRRLETIAEFEAISEGTIFGTISGGSGYYLFKKEESKYEIKNGKKPFVSLAPRYIVQAISVFGEEITDITNHVRSTFSEEGRDKTSQILWKFHPAEIYRINEHQIQKNTPTKSRERDKKVERPSLYSR